MPISMHLARIQAKTGRSIDDFRSLAASKGLDKQREVVAWLMADFGLTHGHANLIAKPILEPGYYQRPEAGRIDALFTGTKAHWRPLYEQLLAELQRLGPDVDTDTTTTYVGFVRDGKKFALVHPASADRLDLGIKLVGEPATERFEAAGNWYATITHRVRITDPAQVDEELLAWLARAYTAVKP
jgi:hypothetical protein